MFIYTFIRSAPVCQYPKSPRTSNLNKPMMPINFQLSRRTENVDKTVNFQETAVQTQPPRRIPPSHNNSAAL